MSILEIKNVTKRFGGVRAISDLSMTVQQGDIAGLIGPNGAGKTTLFNIISGLMHATSGEVLFCGQSIERLPADAIAKRGLIRTFQHVNIYKNFDVLQNLMMGCHLHSNFSLWGALLNSLRYRRNEKQCLEKCENILELLSLGEHRHSVSGSLPHGLQRLLGIGIAIAARPKLMLLDEPTAGLNAEEKARLVEVIRTLNGNSITLLIIEHDMKFVMGICRNLTVVNFGEKIAEGAPEAIRNNRHVQRVYLGGTKDVA